MRTREREVVVEGSQSKEAFIQHSEAPGHLSGRVWPESKPYVWPNLLRSTRDEYACVLQDYDLEIQKLCQAQNRLSCPDPAIRNSQRAQLHRNERRGKRGGKRLADRLQ